MRTRHEKSTRILITVLSVGLLFSTFPPVRPAQSAGPITESGLNTHIGTATIINGKTNYDITGGTRPGNGPNLFHSFGAFDVPTNNIANFFNETNTPTSNILGRVTGGQPSNIFGTIQTTNFAGANLFLINPAGWMFGPSASLNVNGSISISTANYLKFGDGATFFVDPIQTSVLSSSPVAAFGFLGTNPTGRISIQGGTVTGGQPLTIVSRDVGSEAGVQISGGTLSNPSGRINLVSVRELQDATGGEVHISGSSTSAALTPSGFSSLGGITIANGTVTTTGNPGGTVYIRGGSLIMDAIVGHSSILSTTSGAADHLGIGVDIEVSGGIHMTAGQGTAQIASSSGAFNNDGTINTAKTGNAGNIRIHGDTLNLKGDTSRSTAAVIQTRAFSPASNAGQSGNIDITTQHLILDQNAMIQNSTLGPGDAGFIDITATYLNISNGGVIKATTSGTGNGGGINVSANTVTITGVKDSSNPFGGDFTSGGNLTGLSSATYGAGTAGDIKVIANNVHIKDKGTMETGARPNASGDAGNITLDLTGTLSLKGGSTLFATTFSAGKGGNITVDAANVELSELGKFVTSGTSIVDTGVSGITSQSKAEGQAGIITVTAKDIRLFDAASITNATSGPGKSQKIEITADSLTVSGRNQALFDNMIQFGADLSVAQSSSHSNIRANSVGTGNAGEIFITGKNVLVEDHGLISTGTTDIGNAGPITANVDTLTVKTGGEISSTSSLDGAFGAAAGNAGTITVRGLGGAGGSAKNIILDHATLNTQITGGRVANLDVLVNGTLETLPPNIPAGIKITADIVDLANGTTITANTSGTAPAGAITFNVGSLSANVGPGGTPLVNLDRVNLSSSSTGTALNAGNAGSVTIQGRNGSGPADAVTLVSVDVSTDAKGGGAGGSVAIAAAESITLTHTRLSANVNNGTDTIVCCPKVGVPTGDITLTAPAISITGGGITAQTSSERNAGSITLNTDRLTTTAGSVPLVMLSDRPATTNVVISSRSTGLNPLAIPENNPALILPSGALGVIDEARYNAGSVTIQGMAGNGAPVAGAVNLTATDISTAATGTGASGDVTVKAVQPMTLTNSTLSANTHNGTSHPGGLAGNIFVAAPAITITGGAITAQTTGMRNAGSVTLKTDVLLANPGASADGPSTEISTSSLVSPAAARGPLSFAGSANAVYINQGYSGPTPKVVELTNTTVSTSVLPAPEASGPFLHGGYGNSMLISASEHITMVNSILNSDANNRNPGDLKTTDITVTTPALNITGGGITALTTGSRNAGDITLNTDSLTTSPGSVPRFVVRDQPATTHVVISSASTGAHTEPLLPTDGKAGNVMIQGLAGPGTPVAHGVHLDTTDISTAVSAAKTGAGGAITIASAQPITMTNSTLSVNVANGTEGPTGNITITAPSVTMTGAAVTAQSTGSRAGGDITLDATSGDLVLASGSLVSAENAGSGDAGNITLLAGDDIQIRSSAVSTTSDESSGGNIKLTAPSMILLSDSTIVSSVKGGPGSKGGNISLDPLYVVIGNSQILAQANQGAGGNIDITATRLIMIDPSSRISASSNTGLNGAVTVQSPLQNLSGTIVPLKQGVLQAALSGDRCAAMSGGQFSSFVVVGRDAVPPEPGGFVSSPALLESVSLQGSTQSRPNLVAQRLGLLPVMPKPSLSFGEMGCGS
jgi:filamentous hemagglutinin family protein